MPPGDVLLGRILGTLVGGSGLVPEFGVSASVSTGLWQSLLFVQLASFPAGVSGLKCHFMDSFLPFFKLNFQFSFPQPVGPFPGMRLVP